MSMSPLQALPLPPPPPLWAQAWALGHLAPGSQHSIIAPLAAHIRTHCLILNLLPNLRVYESRASTLGFLIQAPTLGLRFRLGLPPFSESHFWAQFPIKRSHPAPDQAWQRRTMLSYPLLSFQCVGGHPMGQSGHDWAQTEPITSPISQLSWPSWPVQAITVTHDGKLNQTLWRPTSI